jgi:hypothetical protein
MVPKGDLEQFQRKQVHCIRQKLHEINKQDVFNDSIVIENILVSGARFDGAKTGTGGHHELPRSGWVSDNNW